MVPAGPHAGKTAVRSIVAGAAVTMAALNVYQARQAQREFPPQGRFVAASGVRLHLQEKGDGRPVVLLHGNGATGEDFRLSGLIDLLATRRYRAVAFDRPGFGYSDRPVGVWSPGRQAELLHAACVTLGIERPIVIGHSWGTLVALALALDFPFRLGGVVLLSGFYRPTIRADVPAFSVPALPIVGDVVRYTIAPPATRAIMPRLIERCFSPLPVPERFALGFPWSLAARPSQIRAEAQDTATMNSATAAMRDRYAALRIPTIIMAGGEDRIVSYRRHAVWLHGKIAHSELRIVPGVGHMIHYAVPEQIVDAIEALAGRPECQAGRVRQHLEAGTDG